MELMEGYTDEQVREIAQQPTPQPMAGTWTLTAPDGRTWSGDSPLRCVTAEVHDRVPPEVALARIKLAMLEEDPDSECHDCGEDVCVCAR